MKPLEFWQKIGTICANGGEEEFETATEQEDSHQDATPRRGAVAFRRRVRSAKLLGI